jgi:hypothetical protein
MSREKINKQRLKNILKHKQEKKMDLTYEGIKAAVLSKGFEFYEEGNYNLNIIWIRMTDGVTNVFNDKCAICYLIDGQPQFVLLDANTKPALYGALYNPVTVDGITGTAVTMPQQVKAAHKFVDLDFIADTNSPDYYNPWKNCYFAQNGTLMTWRDNLKQNSVHHIQPYASEAWHEICLHLQENPLSAPGKEPFSTGCNGWHREDLKNIVVPIVREAVNIWGSLFTYTLIYNE